jgi:hypothetical protein
VIIKVTIFNDPAKLGKAKIRRGIKENYSFYVHDGTEEYTAISKKAKTFISARKAGGYSKRKTWTVKARTGIYYFQRAIKKLQPDIINIIRSHISVNVKDNRLELDFNDLKAGWRDIANRVKEEAMNIIKAEAFDTGDLMSSVASSTVEILGE